MTNRLVAGRYRLGNEATSAVRSTEWSARDEWADGHDVVLTPIAIHDLDDASSRRVRQTIVDEVRILGRLENPAIVRALEIVLDGGQLWVVRAPGPARSLGDVVWGQTLDLAALVGYARDAATALETAHQAGLVHRNIQLGAIRIPDDGPAVVAGFATTVLGENFAVPAPPAFPAPELVTDLRATPATDVFALGVTFQQLFGEPDQLPPAIAELLYAMTAPTAEQRPAAADVAQRFAAILDQTGVAEIAGTEPAPASAAAPGAPAAPTWPFTPRPGSPGDAQSPRYPMPSAQLPGETTARGRRARRRGVVAAAIAGAAALVVTAVLLAPAALSRVREPQAPAPPPIDSPAPFGDPATADPCSLLDVQAFQQYGQTALSRDLLAAAGCTAEITTTGGGFVAVSTTFGSPSAYVPSGQPEQSGDLTIYRQQLTAEICRRTVVLRDGHRIFVDARSGRNPSPSLCVLADAATTTATAAITVGRIGKRPTSNPANALTGISVCNLLDAAVLGRIPNLYVDRREDGFASWSCVWGGDPAFPALPYVSASIVRYRSLEGTPTQIAGRSVLSTPGAEASGTCLFTISHRTFAGDLGGQRVEVLAMTTYVGSGQSPEEACRVGVELVAALAPKLPAA